MAAPANLCSRYKIYIIMKKNQSLEIYIVIFYFVQKPKNFKSKILRLQSKIMLKTLYYSESEELLLEPLLDLFDPAGDADLDFEADLEREPDFELDLDEALDSPRNNNQFLLQ